MPTSLIPILKKHATAFLSRDSYQVLALLQLENYIRICARLLQSLRHSLECLLASTVLSQRLNRRLRNQGNNSVHSQVWSYMLMTLQILASAHLSARIFLEKQVRGGS